MNQTRTFDPAPNAGRFDFTSPYAPAGDQPAAIDFLSRSIEKGHRDQILLGVTGSGKTYTMAQIVTRLNRPTLVLAPNKTLAGQLYNEFKDYFPNNAVEYFVSYYDYYQPEAYIPSSDTYIQKDSSINDLIDKLRHSATRSVLSRRDVLVVASVSCIFGLGAPEDYLAMRLVLEQGARMDRQKLLAELVAMQYERNDFDFHRGVFRVRGDRVEIFPAYEEEQALRIDFFDDEIEQMVAFDPLRGKVHQHLTRLILYPASHYVTSRRTLKQARKTILAELKTRIEHFREQNQLIEAQRVEERTQFDLEMLAELGYCNGIENYSRHLTGRAPGQPPPTLLDYFPEDFLVFVDESHIAIPQLRAMYRGDRSRKQTLVQFGFRLPSALDNRPLKFEETNQRICQVVYVSATPAEYELERSQKQLAEQIVRPTGLLDPRISVRPAGSQVDDLYAEIRKRVEAGERALVTTLTKRLAEDLSDYYAEMGIAVRYLHSDISTLERMELIRDLRAGEFDVLVGINLLREGLDIPEVSLVAILDADKEGFLRSVRSLIQTCGRAARNANGTVIMYADRTTDAMRQAIDETHRRRKLQRAFNQRHGIVPTTIQKKLGAQLDELFPAAETDPPQVAEKVAAYQSVPFEKIDQVIAELEKQMQQAAADLEFEKAARLRDQIIDLKKKMVFETGEPPVG